MHTSPNHLMLACGILSYAGVAAAGSGSSRTSDHERAPVALR
jgi:hypothetical protein